MNFEALGQGTKADSSINMEEIRDIKNSDLSRDIPGCYAYESGQIMCLDADFRCNQTKIASTGHLEQSRPEKLPACSWDPQPVVLDSFCNVGPPATGTNAIAAGSVSQSDSEGSDITTRKARVDLNSPPKSLNLKLSSSVSHYYPGEATKPPNQPPNMVSGFQSVEATRGYYNSRIIPSLSREKQVGLESAMKLGSNGQTFHGYGRSGMNRNYSSGRGVPVSSEIVCGPRADRGRSKSSLNSSTAKANLNHLVCRGGYNKPDFQIKYDEARFFMIKSLSEDDIHKSIKYSVWTSTKNGNNKLDAAFRDAERKKKMGSKCPIFLFFSVNSSGQFVGLAEMIGPVDFCKDMDFWQQERWNGFFPVKWHIIKDIPNRLFYNIMHENEDKVVTFSNDTREIGLRQGLQMLQIFYDHQPVTSLLDDFGFYEHREKQLRATRCKRSGRMRSDMESGDDSSSMWHLEEAVSKMKITGKSITFSKSS